MFSLWEACLGSVTGTEWSPEHYWAWTQIQNWLEASLEHHWVWLNLLQMDKPHLFIYSLAVLEVKVWNGSTLFLLEILKERHSLHLWLLKASCIPWFMALPLSSKPATLRLLWVVFSPSIFLSISHTYQYIHFDFCYRVSFYLQSSFILPLLKKLVMTLGPDNPG